MAPSFASSARLECPAVKQTVHAPSARAILGLLILVRRFGRKASRGNIWPGAKRTPDAAAQPQAGAEGAGAPDFPGHTTLKPTRQPRAVIDRHGWLCNVRSLPSPVEFAALDPRRCERGTAV